MSNSQPTANSGGGQDASSPGELSAKRRAYLALKQMQARVDRLERARTEPIAIIGMACRFPGAPDLTSYWTLLREGVDAIAEVPPDRWDVDAHYDPDPDRTGKTYTRWGGFIEQVDRFDARFFGISPREAMLMDPQHRLLLEVSWEALERAGQAPDRLDGSSTGVFIGICSSDYVNVARHYDEPSLINAYFGSGNAFSTAAGRISYVLGLQGPSLAIDTACSSSLMTVHLASQSLRQDECGMALVGGVNLILSPESTINFSRARMLAFDGRCKTFDEAADGYVRGEGCGMLVLKRLSRARDDGDPVLAVIRSSAANQDGRSSGLTAPNGPSQERVIRKALEAAGLRPADVDYIEAHGTGTSLGDPIEFQALARVFGEDRPPDRPLRIGSVKTNIGHLEAAAGAAGLMKVILALRHGELPAHLHLKTLSPHCRQPDPPMRIPTRLEPWTAGESPRRAGVSGFGFSGTNVHLIVESVDSSAASVQGGHPTRRYCLAPVSGKTPNAVRQAARQLGEWLACHRDARPQDVGYTAGDGRAHWAHRFCAVGETADALREQMQHYGEEHMPIGTFAGQREGTNPVRVAFLFGGGESYAAGIGDELYAGEPAYRHAVDACNAAWHSLGLRDTGAETDLFTTQYALARLLEAWGIRPTAVVGHGTGEIAAACIAGILTLDDAAVMAGHTIAREQDRDERQTEHLLPRISTRTPSARLFSASSGRMLQREDLTSPSYWAALRSDRPPQWNAVVDSLRQAGCGIAVDVGTQPWMIEQWRRAAPTDSTLLLATLVPRVGAEKQILESVARMYVHGVDVHWSALYGEGSYTILALPTYPFERKRYWLDDAIEEPKRPAATPTGHSLLPEYQVLPNGERVFVAALNTPETAFLQEHRIYGDAVMPATGYLEMALEAASSALGQTGCALEDVEFLAPLFLGGDAHRAARLIWQGEPGSSTAYETFSIQSAQGEPGHARVVHARGRIGPLEPMDDNQATLDVAAVKKRCWQPVAPRLLYNGFSKMGLELDNAFRGVHSIRRRAGEVLGGIRLPEGLHADRSGFLVHPALFDACLQMVALVSLDRGTSSDAVYLPVSAQSVRFSGISAGNVAWSRSTECKTGDASDGETAWRDVWIHDAKGRLVVAIRGLCFRRVSRGMMGEVAEPLPGPPSSTDWLYRVEWEEGEPVSVEEAAGLDLPRESPGSAWMILVDSEGLGDDLAGRLRSDGHRCVTVCPSSSFERIAEDRYALCQADPDGWRALLEDAFPAPPGVLNVVVLWGLYHAEGNESELHTVTDVVQQSCAGTLNVVQTLTQPQWEGRGRVWLCTRGVQSVGPEGASPSIAQAPLWGLGHVVSLEHPEYQCRRIDVDAASSRAECLAQWLAEFRRETDRDDQVAYRGGRRYVPRLVRFVPDEPLSPPESLKPDRTYMIAGGLGGLGMCVAEWLVRRGAKHIALVGRRAPSADSESTIRGLRGGGARMEAFQADVSRREDVAGLFRDLQPWPPLGGVVHAAGRVEDGVLLNQSWAQFDRVLAPKVRGAWLLHEFTSGMPLDFFVLFSSGTALLGSPGQGNYVAANTFLDAFAHWRAARGMPALSINWGPWTSVGAAAARGFDIRAAAAGLGVLEPEQGIHALETLIRHHIAQVGVLPIDWPTFLSQFPEEGRPAFLDRCATWGQVPSEPGGAGPEASMRRRLEAADPTERESLLTEMIREQVSRVLRLDSADSVSPREPLSELGLDSLMAVELRGALQTGLGETLPASLLFERPTIAGIASHLTRSLFGEVAAAEASATSLDVDLAQEADLGELEVADVGWSNATRSAPRVAFMTGATGYLGGYLLADLLQETDWNVVCLVRSSNDAEGIARLRRRLDSIGRWDEAFENRLRAVAGDLTQPGFGLPESVYEQLADTTDIVYHGAATVNFVLPYSALKPVTVLGTQEVLRFVGRQRIKPLHYVSSIAVFISSFYVDAELLPEDHDANPGHGFPMGYSASKWVAERLVTGARAKGVPVSIYRPSLVSGHSVNGNSKWDDLFPRMIRSCAELGIAPMIADRSIDFAPVDYVSRAIVHLSTHRPAENRSFNLVHPHAMMWDAFVNAIRSHGYALNALPYGQWMDRLREAAAESALSSLMPFLERIPESLLGLATCDHRNTTAGLADSNVVCPDASALLDRYIRHFQATGWMAGPLEASGVEDVP